MYLKDKREIRIDPYQLMDFNYKIEKFGKTQVIPKVKEVTSQ